MPSHAHAPTQLKDAMHRHGHQADPVFAFLFLIADMLIHLDRRLETMAIDESKFGADLTQMANDISEVKDGVAAILAKGDSATQAEVDSLTGKLDTTAAALRDAASQFDPAAPPAPTPDASKRHK